MPATEANPLKSYHVQYDSMEPTITAGSDVIGDRSYYSKHKPERWDVVVFTLKGSPGCFIKRIVGLPGETIQFTPGGLKINSADASIPKKLADRFSAFTMHREHTCGNEPHRIPDDSVFVIGDNTRIYVADSRLHDAVPIANLEARVLAGVHTTWLT
jgi:signal peptidase I